MKIQVLAAQRDHVRFRSAFGEAEAQWKGEGVPEPGDYAVELDVGEHGGARRSSSTGPSLSGSAGALLLRGLVDSVGPDDVSFHLRIGEHLVIIDGTLDPALVGQWVELDVKELGLVDLQY
jgi:hypothetical protein